MKRMAILLLLLATMVTPAAAESISYSYDAAGRLQRVTYSSGKSIVYTYDANGNLLSRQVGSGVRRRAVRASLKPPENGVVVSKVASP